MTVLVNLGTGSTDGTAVTTGNSGGTGSNAFNAVSTVASTSAAWEADNRWPDATLGIRYSANAGAGQAAYTSWTTSLVAAGGTASQLNVSCAMFVTSLPPSGTDLPIMRGLFTGNQRWRVGLTPAGKIIATINPNTLVAGTSSLTISTGTLYWIEIGAIGDPTTGSVEVRIYNSSGTLLETMGPYTGLNTGGPVNEIRHGIGASVSPSGVAASIYLSHLMAGDAGWQGPPVAAAPSVAVGPTSGAVTSATAKAAWRLDDAAGLNCRMVVSTASNLLTSPVYSSAAAPDADGIFMASVSGLTASTAYHYGVEVDGTILADGRGQFRTFPTEGEPASFAVSFGSCQITNQDSNTWDLIRTYNGAQGPALVLAHLGDYGYPDWTTAVGAAVVRAHYEQQMLLPKLRAMHAALPWSYVPNNHDWAGDLCDKNSLSGPSVSAAHRQMIPSYTLPDADDIGFWHSWVIGRVRFISLDMRSSRDPALDTDNSSKSMLGANQLAWLETELQQDEPLKVIFSDPWRAEGASSGRWGAYTYEFDIVNDMIDLYAPGRVIIGSGDRHALGADDGTANNTRGRPCMLGAPFNQGSTQDFEVWSDGYFYSYQTPPVEENVDAAGFMEFEDDGSSIIFTYRGLTSDGVERVTYAQTFNLSVSKSADLRWNSQAVVTDATDLRWNSFAGVADAVDLRWSTPAVATDALDLRWNTSAVVTDSLDLRYNSYAIGAYSLDLRYGTYIEMSVGSDLRYNSYQSVLDHLGLLWTTYELVTDALDLAWADYVAVQDSVDLRWDTPAVAEADIDLRYNLAAIVQADEALRWNTYQLISVDEDILWNVEGFGSVSAAMMIRYSTYAVASDAAAINYHTYIEVSDSIVARWDVLRLVEQSNNLRWSVGGGVLASVDLLWDTEGIERTVIVINQDTGPVTADLGSDGPLIVAAPSTEIR